MNKIPSDFNWKEYLSLNPDIAKDHSSKELATQHYKLHGEADKRPYKASNIPDDFNWEEYLNLNPDIAKDHNSKELATLHYRLYGESENRLYESSSALES